MVCIYSSKKKKLTKLEKHIKKHFDISGSNNIAQIIPEVRKWLSLMQDSKRFNHSLSTEKTARKIAYLTGVDGDKAALAALIHDCAKLIPEKKLARIIKKHNIDLNKRERLNFSSIHAPVGAFIAKKKLGIKDKEILNAIRYHVTGRDEMNRIEKVVYIADEIEPYLRQKSLNRKAMKLLKAKNSLKKVVKLVS